MGTRERILVVDRDELLLIELQGALENEGFDTTTTWEYSEAIQLLRFHDFDFVLVGDHPPELDARALAAELQARHSTASCLVMQVTPASCATLALSGALAIVDRRRHKDIVRIVNEHLAAWQRAKAA